MVLTFMIDPCASRFYPISRIDFSRNILISNSILNQIIFAYRFADASFLIEKSSQIAKINV